MRKIHASLRTGGELIIDCQGIPGDDPVALMPRNRYTQAQGIWWLPMSVSYSLVAAHCFSNKYFAQLSAVMSSGPRGRLLKALVIFLILQIYQDVKGYPAPWRFYIKT